MDISLPRIINANPTYSQWLGAINTVPTAGTETPNIYQLDMGAVAQSNNSVAKALSLEFASNFDDSCYSARIYMLNKPAMTDHAWMYEAGLGAKFPVLALDDPLTNGIAIPGNPLDATWQPANIYDSTNKRVCEMLFQLQCGAAATVFDQSLQPVEPPFIMIELQRRDTAVSALPQDFFPLSMQNGQFLTFSDAWLYVNVNSSWQRLGMIRPGNIAWDETSEVKEWQKGHPMVTYHQVLSSMMSKITCTLDEVPLDIWAATIDESVADNSSARTYRVVNSAKARPTREIAVALEWMTLGGYKCVVSMPRARVRKTAPYSPDKDDFSGLELEITALAGGGCGRGLSVFDVSKVPLEMSCMLPVTYSVTL